MKPSRDRFGRGRWAWLVLLCACSPGDAGTDPEDGSDPRRIKSELTNAFLNLEFEWPVALSGAPAGLPRLYVAERSGRIIQFDNDLQVEGQFDFLDIRDRVLDDGEEGGLRGFAFDPAWATTGYVYVHYIAANPRRSVLSRFAARNRSVDALDAASEEVLLTVDQPHAARPGGPLRFGPDGLLYVALGDGGPEGDPEGHGQDPRTLRGSILRLDVRASDGVRPYTIPADNPFADSPAAGRPEVFAWGFRDPSGIDFAEESGLLWVTDRGPRRFDEVNLVRKGGNYGWRTMEATACYAPMTACDGDGLTIPAFHYGGASITRGIVGGFVYRGSRNPELRGRYIMADRASGQVWALDRNGSTAIGEPIVRGNAGFIAIGVDAGGEPLFANAATGQIYRFVWTSP